MRRKTAGPRVGLVAADALEDARCRSGGRARRRGPSRRPSRPARRSSRSSPSRASAARPFGRVLARNRTRRLAQIGRARVGEPQEVGGAIPAMCVSRARLRSRRRSWPEQRALHQHLRDARRRERRDPARLEARRGPDLFGPRDAPPDASGGRRDLALVRPPVAGDERQRRTAVADEDERLDDLRESAADGLGRGARRSAFPRGTPRPARRCRPARALLRPAAPAPASSPRRDRNAKPGDGHMRSLGRETTQVEGRRT